MLAPIVARIVPNMCPPCEQHVDRQARPPLNNPVGQFVYNAHPGLVDSVLVDGRVVKRSGMITTVDPQNVRRMAYESRDDIVRTGE